MRIRLLKPYGFSRPGDVLEPDDPVAQLLIERGIAEVDKEVERMPSSPSPFQEEGGVKVEPRRSGRRSARATDKVRRTKPASR
jgi:hypothetical protein